MPYITSFERIGMEKGLQLEARYLGELVRTRESKALVHIYRASESATKLGRALAAEAKGAKVAVIGAGTMGAGIAGLFLTKGHPVAAITSAIFSIVGGLTALHST